MTALMHSAYRGNNDACTVLLEKGADVNSNAQQNGVWQCLLSFPNILLSVPFFLLAVHCIDVCHNSRSVRAGT